jgi:ferritin-like metal-binding protein YciE
MEQIHDMLVEQLKDAVSAEKQAVQGMKKLLRQVADEQLRQGIEMHMTQSEEQQRRAERALEAMGGKPGRKVCEAMRGLNEELNETLQEFDKGPVRDLALIAGLQRIEHYEIAAYGTMAELARAIGEDEVADLVEQTLQEEKDADEKLTRVTRESVLPTAMQEEEGEEEEEDEAPRRRSASTGQRAQAKSTGSSRKTATRSASKGKR